MQHSKMRWINFLRNRVVRKTTGIVIAEGLNVHETVDDRTAKDAMAQGDHFEVLDTYEGSTISWLYVKYDRGEGWVAKRDKVKDWRFVDLYVECREWSPRVPVVAISVILTLLVLLWCL